MLKFLKHETLENSQQVRATIEKSLYTILWRNKEHIGAWLDLNKYINASFCLR